MTLAELIAADAAAVELGAAPQFVSLGAYADLDAAFSALAVPCDGCGELSCVAPTQQGFCDPCFAIVTA